MNDATSMTLENPFPADMGTFTYIITDGYQHDVALTVPAMGTIQHPTDPANAPWNIVATLNGPGPTGVNLSFPAVSLNYPDAVITAGLNIVMPSIPVVPPSDSAGFVPPVRTSLLDPGNWQSGTAAPQAGTPPASMKLVFAMQYQLQNQWCWAALTASVLAYYAPTSTTTQCSLANWAFGQSNCCTALAAPVAPCNQPFGPDAALTQVKCWNSTLLQALLFGDVVAQIAAAKPIAIRITWQGGQPGAGHALCIVGYDSTDPSAANATIDLKDPTFGETVVKFPGFPGNYHGGLNWTHTFLTQAPPQ